MEPSWKDCYYREREALERLQQENDQLRADLKEAVKVMEEVKSALDDGAGREYLVVVLEDALAKIERKESGS